MPRTKTPIVTIYLYPDEVSTLQELAAFCGYYQKRGRMELPNISALNRAITSLPKERWQALKDLLEAAE